MLREAGECDGPTQNKKDYYSFGRFIAKTLYLPARSRFGEGRAAPLTVTLLSFKGYYKVHFK